MHKKLMYIVHSLIFCTIGSSVMSGAPGAEQWIVDRVSAPAHVRRAADALWSANDRFSDEMWQWTFHREQRVEGQKYKEDFCCCGCCYPSGPNVTEEGTIRYQFNNLCSGNESVGAYKQRGLTAKIELESMMKDKFSEFIRAVNNGVARPESYEGDVKFAELGHLVAATERHKEIKESVWWVGVAYDLSTIPDKVRTWVRDHGGWSQDAQQAAFVVTRTMGASSGVGVISAENVDTRSELRPLLGVMH